MHTSTISNLVLTQKQSQAFNWQYEKLQGSSQQPHLPLQKESVKDWTAIEWFRSSLGPYRKDPVLVFYKDPSDRKLSVKPQKPRDGNLTSPMLQLVIAFKPMAFQFHSENTFSFM